MAVGLTIPSDTTYYSVYAHEEGVFVPSQYLLFGSAESKAHPAPEGSAVYREVQ